jgi:hypothetical protein
VVYAAETIAIAVLETAAHIDNAGLPLDRFVIRIDVPSDIWRARDVLDVKKLDAYSAFCTETATCVCSLFTDSEREDS